MSQVVVHLVNVNVDSEDRIRLEHRLLADGFWPSPLAPIAEVNDAIEAGCSFCLAQGYGLLEIRPYWRGPRLRLVVTCHSGHHSEER